ncbi:VF530 family DNA-binding protein [Oceanospirillum beijerinckii]|uniref:VF530 family protein n=1 Tax=Oceanospirillum beijerinckii TaxID=64976 RepID=UPI00040A28AC|nr:VF530 family DNA-binding protein [Oceanospirillum beijerinckii]MAC48492.1 DUF2132 domain-containing protein [Oceanospirillum sp.]
MNDEINYKNNPLHGVGLKDLLIEMVDHYGFDILYAYLNINCFKTKPSIESSVKFLKKTDWAREKVEAFYMYKFKNLPKASPSQQVLPPRDRIVPDGQIPGEPARLSLEDAEHLRKEREKRAVEFDKSGGRRASSDRGNDQRSGSYSRNRRSRHVSHDGGSGGQGIWSKRSTDTAKSSSTKPTSPWEQATRKDSGSDNRAPSGENSESPNTSDRTGASDPWGNWKK